MIHRLDVRRPCTSPVPPPAPRAAGAGYFDSILSGCVPVVFSASYGCAFYDWAYSAQLPRQQRSGFGAGDYSVLLVPATRGLNLRPSVHRTAPRPIPARRGQDSERAAADPEYTRQQLEQISDAQYRRMQRTLVRLQRRVLYSQGETAERDAAQMIGEQLTKRRAPAQGAFGKLHEDDSRSRGPL